MTNMYGLWDKFALALKRFGIHTYIHNHTHTTTRTRTPARTHIHIHTHTHTHTYTYTYGPFEIETVSHETRTLRKRYEQNTIRNPSRRIKQFVCLSVFISTHEAMLSERFGEIICAFSECVETQNGANITKAMRIEYDSKSKQLRTITKAVRIEHDSKFTSTH